jgi:hypothetical protein
MDISTVLESLQAFLLLVWSFPGVKFITCHVLVNLVVAVAASLKVGEFELSRLAEFLTKKLAPYALVYAAAMIFGEAVGLAPLAPAALAAIEAALLGDLADNLVKIGLPLPVAVKRLVVK